jgi:hypothetical protein
MNEPHAPAWCQGLSNLSDRELGLLVDCAAAVIAEGSGEDAELRELRELPAPVLAPDLAEELGALGVHAGQQQVREIAGQAESSRLLATALLEQICAIPALRAEVDAAYVASQRMMIVDPVSITAISLLVLVMKLRKVKVGRAGVEVTLDPIKKAMVSVIKDLLGS